MTLPAATLVVRRTAMRIDNAMRILFVQGSSSQPLCTKIWPRCPAMRDAEDSIDCAPPESLLDRRVLRL
jgi:hypothetical protein